uniref:C-type lectin domain-containing protein n=1 Tax=Poecilia reticulata TaxID=8081 RepID=A0A3P9N603_POERE
MIDALSDGYKREQMILLFLLFGLSLAAVVPSDRQEMTLRRGGCPPFWFIFNGRCYKYVATLMTWADAEQHCVTQGANLVSIHSVEEDNFVKLLIRNFDPTQGVNGSDCLTLRRTERISVKQLLFLNSAILKNGLTYQK